MLFFINTRASPIGNKIRDLIGLPTICFSIDPNILSPRIGRADLMQGLTADGIINIDDDNMINDEVCGDGTCVNVAKMMEDELHGGRSRRGSAADTVKGEIEKVKENFQRSRAGTLDTIVEDFIDMHMVIMDIPGGGDYFKYPCTAELPSPILLEPLPGMSRRNGMIYVDNNEEFKGGLSNQYYDHGESPYSTDTTLHAGQANSGKLTPLDRENARHPFSPRSGLSEMDRMKILDSPSTITTAEKKGEDDHFYQSTLRISNICHVARQFISDYRDDKLIR